MTYRKGVLTGNWAEELLRSEATAPDPMPHKSVHQESYPRFTSDQIAAARSEPALSSASTGSSLFAHRGAPSEDVRFLSASKLAYIHPKDQVPPRKKHGRPVKEGDEGYRSAYQLTKTEVLDKAKARWSDDKAASHRDAQMVSVAKGEHTIDSSTQALPPGHHESPHARRGKMLKSLDNPMHALQLRKDP